MNMSKTVFEASQSPLGAFRIAAIMIGLGLSFAAGLIIPRIVISDTASPALIITYSVLLVTVIGATIARTRRGANPSDPMIILGFTYILSFGVAPIAHWLTGIYVNKDLYGGRTPEQLMTQVLFAALITFFCAQLGYGLKIGRMLGKWLPHPGNSVRRLRFLGAVLAFTVIGLVSNYALFRALGGTSFYETGRTGKAFAGLSPLTVFGQLTWVALIMQASWYYERRAAGIPAQARERIWLGFQLAASASMLFVNLGRTSLAAPLFMFLVVRYAAGFKIRGITLIVGVVLAALVFVLINTLRSPNVGWVTGVAHVGWQDVLLGFTRDLQTFLTTETSRLDTTMGYLARSENSDVLWGQTISWSLFQFVPRLLFPAKPAGAPALMMDAIYGKGYYASLPTGGLNVPGLIAELHMNFRWLGVVIGFFIVGISLRAVTEYLRLHRHDMGARMVYAPLAYIIFGLLTGAIFMEVNVLVNLLVPILLAMWWCRTPGAGSRSQ